MLYNNTRKKVPGPSSYIPNWPRTKNSKNKYIGERDYYSRKYVYYYPPRCTKVLFPNEDDPGPSKSSHDLDRTNGTRKNKEKISWTSLSKIYPFHMITGSIRSFHLGDKTPAYLEKGSSYSTFSLRVSAIAATLL